MGWEIKPMVVGLRGGKGAKVITENFQLLVVSTNCAFVDFSSQQTAHLSSFCFSRLTLASSHCLAYANEIKYSVLASTNSTSRR